MQKALIVVVTLVLTSLVVASPLVACPFLQGKPSCYRRTSSHAPRCPLAPTLERCPFYLTEAKIGLAEAKGTFVSLPATLVSQPLSTSPVASRLDLHRIRLPDQSGVYLLHRVLRI
jgi:hypothetical protein